MSDRPFHRSFLHFYITITDMSISITGLLAARVCADHFERVMIIEADEGADTSFPAAVESKKDVYGNSNYVSRRPRVAQSFEIHCR